MQLRRTALVSALAISCVVALSACSASPDGDGEDAQTSPLTTYFEAIYGGDLSPEEQQEKYAADDRKREELVAACMAEQGFEYTPNVQSATFSSSDGSEYKPEDREWVAQYGYGMVNYPGRDEPADPEQEYVDANADYVASLSESEQAAFNEALSGPPVTEEQMEADGSYEYDWQTAGCYGSAQHEMEGEDPMQSDTHKPVMDALNQFYSDQQNSPELADLDVAWASCMADSGHPGFTKQFEAQNSLNEEMNKLYETAGDQQIDPTGPEFTRLGEKEVELALVDLDCREKTDYRAQQKKVTDRLEQQFIDDHKAELDALKADAEQGR